MPAVTTPQPLEWTETNGTSDAVRALVHPRGWRNPDPAARYDLVVLGGDCLNTYFRWTR